MKLLYRSVILLENNNDDKDDDDKTIRPYPYDTQFSILLAVCTFSSNNFNDGNHFCVKKMVSER